jgi:hypothetical protein
MANPAPYEMRIFKEEIFGPVLFSALHETRLVFNGIVNLLLALLSKMEKPVWPSDY